MTPPTFRSLVELLRFRACAMPLRRAHTFLIDGESEGASHTYGDLDARARAVAAALQGAGLRPGDRALLVYAPGLEVIAGFFGCLYAGVVAVPVYPPHPAQVERSSGRLLAIAGDADVRAVLTTSALAGLAPMLAAHAPSLAAAPWLSTDLLPQALADEWRDPDSGPATLAFLQYTSGSTAAPRGVMVTHGNLLHNLAAAAHVEENDDTSVSVSWLPVIHDMGLIEGVLEPVWGGYPAYLMPPAAFLQRPLRWLRAISRYGATNSGGPDFAWELCVRRIAPEQRTGLDLSSWRVAYNGAEPIRRDTLRAFHEAFSPHGFRWRAFYPVYGLAEATLVVSSGGRAYEPHWLELDADALGEGRVIARSAAPPVIDDATPAGRAATLVACGAPVPGTRVVIADPERLVRTTDGEIGEIWLSSPSVARGYWRKPEETSRTFHAHLADTGEGPFLRTGDLGFLRDGELFIAGRLKDVIIVRGLKHFPQDLELVAERRHPALRPGCCAAFGVADGGIERVVLVAEVDHRRPFEVDAVVGAIRHALGEAHGIQLDGIALLRKGTILKTTSGKIRRRACRDAWLAGTLNEICRWTSADGFTERACVAAPGSRDASPARGATNDDAPGVLAPTGTE